MSIFDYFNYGKVTLDEIAKSYGLEPLNRSVSALEELNNMIADDIQAYYESQYNDLKNYENTKENKSKSK